MNSIEVNRDSEQATMTEPASCKKMKSHYYICLKEKAIAWNPADPSPEIIEAKSDCVYFGKLDAGASKILRLVARKML